MGAAQLCFGDLILDGACLSGRRHGQPIHFTRNERALLLAFTSNPKHLMSRSRLLDEIDSSELDRSDRYIDFLVNQVRMKLGDSKKTPKYIATQYGEGYIWIATPSSATPIDAFLVIGGNFGAKGHTSGSPEQARVLLDQLRDLVAAGVGMGQLIVAVDENWQPAATDKLRYFLPVSFQAGDGQLKCMAALREMPSKSIVKTFQFHLDAADPAVSAREAARVANGIVDVLRQALAHAAKGLGVPADESLEMRLHKASALLSASNLEWQTRGARLRRDRERNPRDPDLALQWCMYLFATLVAPGPFAGMGIEERERIESEIEATVLELLPTVEGSPLLMLTAAKQLYFIDRGHLDLAEDIAERAFVRIADYAAALPIMGQLQYARGRFDEAVRFFDRGIAMVEPGPAFHLHMKMLKCYACLAAGDHAALEATAVDLDAYLGPFCTPDISLTIRWIIAPPDRDLPATSAQALAGVGPEGARKAIEYFYFASARHLVSQGARANLMHRLITHATRAHGQEAIPAFISRRLGLRPARAAELQAS
ncbi:MAG TPA: helix-turn-helix domain-containing protein [Caulobacteraceae bacterium]|jgi:DNA-binding winged helix-turn-helix (wHTH) protein